MAVTRALIVVFMSAELSVVPDSNWVTALPTTGAASDGVVRVPRASPSVSPRVREVISVCNNFMALLLSIQQVVKVR